MLFNKKTDRKDEKEAVYTISVKEYSEMSAEERLAWHPINPKHEKIPLFAKIALIIFAVSVVIYIIAMLSEPFADFFNQNVSHALRFVLSKLTGVLPFSFAELIIILLPVIAFVSLWYLLKYRCDTRKATIVTSVCILSVASMFLSSFVLCFGTAYRGTPLEEKLNITSAPVNKQELYEASEHLLKKINELSEKIEYSESGFSVMPYDFDEMNDKLIEAYDSFCTDYAFIRNFKSQLKPVMLSEAMSYTHITGVYTFFTGESNINVNFPDYTIPYTSAHELAHQRGIAREDEANMIAFLVCIRSEDPYIQYSAYLNVYEYVSTALYYADKELYKEIRQKISSSVYGEQVAYSKFFDKYDNSVASQVSIAVNDAYLKTQGTQGSISYGMVVDLTVAYFKSLGIIEN